MRRSVLYLVVFFLTFISFRFSAYALEMSDLHDLKINPDYSIPWMGTLMDREAYSEEKFIKEFKTAFLSEQHEFVFSDRRTDNIGMTHVRYKQYAYGYEIKHATLILHLRKGHVESFNGEIYPVASAPDAILSIEDAIDKYISLHPIDRDLVQAFELEDRTPVFALSDGSPDLGLSYKMVLSSDDGTREDHVYISAISAELLRIEPQVIHTDSTGTAKTYFRGTQTVVADYLGTNSFRLKDNARNLNTYDGSLGAYVTDTDNKWETSGKEIAGDVHWGMGELHNFMDEKFGWDSYANNGDSMVAILNFSGSGNAFWNLGGNYATFLVNKTTRTEPCAAIDVVGHEFGHGIADENANMVYRGETCMLHESFGDISGAALEYYIDSAKANWLLGDEVWNGGIRNIQNPATFNHPKTYKGTNWGRGCHANGGVQNYWFYLVAEGDTGTNDFSHSFAVPGMGRDTALQIIFRAIFYYARPQTTYPDMASYTLKATKDLYGTCGKELQMVWDAWKAVGIEDTTVQLINLDHGVVANKLRCTSLPVDQSFKSLGDPSRSVMWDFGNNDTSSKFNVSRTFSSYGPKTVYLSTTVCNKTFKDTFTVQVNAQPTAEFTPNQNVFCFNNGDTLRGVNNTKNPDASQNLEYKWTIEPYLFEYTTKDLTLPINGLKYNFTVQLDAFYKSGCTSNTRKDFSLLPAPVAEFSVEDVCEGEKIIPVNVTDTSRALDMVWEVRDLNSGSVLATSTDFAPEFNISSTGQIQVIMKATDPESKCESVDMDTAEIFANPTPTFTREGACLNDTVTFTHTTQHNVNLTWFQWNFGIYRPFNKEVVHYIPRQTGTLKFSLEARDDNGCKGIVHDSIEIEQIEASFDVEDFCQNTTSTVVNNSTGGINSYAWDLGDGTQSTDAQPDLSYTESGKYNVTLTARSDNCSHTVSSEVEVFPVPVPDFSVEGVCAGDSSHFTNLTDVVEGSQSRWGFGDGDTSTETDPSHFFEIQETTTFNVSLKMSNEYGCSDIKYNVVTINELPRCGFSWEYKYPSREVRFLPDSSGYSSYSWDFGDGNSSTNAEPLHKYEQDKNYVVALEIEDDNGCQCIGRKSVRGTNVSVGTISAEQWRVYPNPNTGTVRIDGPEARSSIRYTVTDIHGRAVRSGIARTNESIDLRKLADGTYMFRLETAGETVTQPLVIHRN